MPTVFMENRPVVALDPSDPIVVDYIKPVGNDPTGKDHLELLKMRSSPNHGHDNVANQHPEKVKELSALLHKIKTDGRSRN